MKEAVRFVERRVSKLQGCILVGEVRDLENVIAETAKIREIFLLTSPENVDQWKKAIPEAEVSRSCKDTKKLVVVDVDSEKEPPKAPQATVFLWSRENGSIYKNLKTLHTLLSAIGEVSRKREDFIEFYGENPKRLKVFCHNVIFNVRPSRLKSILKTSKVYPDLMEVDCDTQQMSSLTVEGLGVYEEDTIPWIDPEKKASEKYEDEPEKGAFECPEVEEELQKKASESVEVKEPLEKGPEGPRENPPKTHEIEDSSNDFIDCKDSDSSPDLDEFKPSTSFFTKSPSLRFDFTQKWEVNSQGIDDSPDVALVPETSSTSDTEKTPSNPLPDLEVITQPKEIVVISSSDPEERPPTPDPFEDENYKQFLEKKSPEKPAKTQRICVQKPEVSSDNPFFDRFGNSYFKTHRTPKKSQTKSSGERSSHKTKKRIFGSLFGSVGKSSRKNLFGVDSQEDLFS